MKRYLIAAIFISLIITACGKKKNAEYYMEKGMESFETKDYDGAVENYLLAISFDSKSALAHNYLGIAYRFKYNMTRNRDFKKNEEEAFKKAIELDKNFWVAMINLAATYYYDNRKGESIPLFKKALELNPDNPEKTEIEKLIKDYEDSLNKEEKKE